MRAPITEPCVVSPRREASSSLRNERQREREEEEAAAARARSDTAEGRASGARAERGCGARMRGKR